MNEIGVEQNLEGMEESGDYDGLDKEKIIIKKICKPENRTCCSDTKMIRTPSTCEETRDRIRSEELL